MGRRSRLVAVAVVLSATRACLGIEDSESATGADAGSDHFVSDSAWPDGKGGGSGGGSDASGGTDASDASSAPTKLVQKTKSDLPPYSGDGYIGMPAGNCQSGVHEDGASCPGQPCIAVGTDPPCGVQARYRAYFRFELAALGGAKPKSATLHLYLLTKSEADANAKLQQIADYGSLEVSDWDGTVKHDYSTFLTPSSPLDWLTKDVTAELTTELDAGATAIAFMLRYDSESQIVSSSHWYGIGCAEGNAAAPYISLTY